MKKGVYLFMAGLVLFTACQKKDAVKKNEGQETIEKVKIEKASSKEIDQIYEFTTTVDAAVKNFISSQGGSRIEKIWVEVGQKVGKGQKLVTMESTNLTTSRTQLSNLKIEVDRIDALYNSGGVSKQQLDQIRTQYEVAKKNIENLEKNITLLSPISGIITMRNFDNGDLAGSQPILQVMQIAPVKLKFNVNESFYNKIKVGMSVIANIEVFEQEEFKGRVSLIAPTIDPLTRTFMVEAEFSNSNHKMRPGMFGRIMLNLGKAQRILVSDKAIVKQSGTNNRYVYIEEEGVIRYSKVELGRRLDDKYEIISGVKDGENVVISGTSRLTDGKKVSVISE